jgi:homoserine O-acetyltransferase/O-succinyltransferase
VRAIKIKQAQGETMIENEYYGQEGHGPYELHSIGDLQLEEGGTIRNCQLAVATFGSLNAPRDNAILVPTWYSGTSKIMEQVYIGKGRALDPEKYFIIAINQIGSGLSTSPHNTPMPGGHGHFPRVRIGDDVRAQHKLLTERFGIDKLALVVGGSMGAQQTYEWAVRRASCPSALSLRLRWVGCTLLSFRSTTRKTPACLSTNCARN